MVVTLLGHTINSKAMKKKIIIPLLSLSINFLFAQNEGNIWYFGYNCGLDFNSGTPTVLSNSAMRAHEGCSSISDSGGNLLFYTDGDTVWNSNHVPMPNGTGLTGNETSTQSAMIVKQPGTQNIYYIFSLFTDYCYSVVDMSLNGGLGDVTSAKNVMIFSGISTEKQCATYSSNGTDIWILMHNSNIFYAYQLTSTGFNALPVQSTIGLTDQNNYGQMKFSPQGDKVAFGIYTNSTTPDICLSDFDNSTGIVSNNIDIYNGNTQCYGVEFSSDGSKLYASSHPSGAIYQYDLNAGSSAAIIASQTQIGSSLVTELTGLQIGPDKKIYACLEGSHFLAVINSPDSLGTACNFADSAINLGIGYCQLGFPELIAGYYNPPLALNPTDDNNLVSVSPNPFNDYLLIRNNKFQKCFNIILYDIAGRKILETLIVSPFQRINIPDLSSSIYFLEVNYDRKRSLRKLVKR